MTLPFSGRSFDVVGVDAIAAAAGITGSAVYRHFSSKDEVLAALVYRLLDALLIRIGEPIDSPRGGFRRPDRRTCGILDRQSRARNQLEP
ncbi:TetR family transcriptional regulator [Rhodococcus sp. 4CII]|uniref:TetR family transcriptional regulator n=1 Tax=Rhodococcus sp. 4CII TaxID=2834580 RepID=UPI00163A625F|nr:TetR family transcriptional regulator [Rhodococcus sp. 4CII]MBC2640421.1 TetR family transcriptional regulator [Rhodococcus sp. 3A]MBC2894833.1 TetR family transcriptional regulator [Rhodococcus sp. 4CII]